MERFREAAMTRHLARNMLFCLVLALALPGTAMAGNPIPSIDVIVRKNPGGDNLMVHTDGSGRARLEGLVPGNYTLTVRGQSLVAAMDRLAAPARRSGSGRIAVGDLNGDGTPDVAARGGPVIQVTLDLGTAGRFSRTAPYRRDHAGEGLSLAFTIPSRGGARPGLASGTVLINAISDQASAGWLESY
jgi:Carboxypeptidase regulatory-like domain